MNRVRSIIPFPGKSPLGATVAALASGSAAAGLAPKRQRSATIASLSSQASRPASTLKALRRIDIGTVNSDGLIHQTERNPFNVYPEGVPAPLGFFLTTLAVGFLLAGIVVAGSVLIGVL